MRSATTTGSTSCPSSTPCSGSTSPPERVDQIVDRLERQELNRARWIESHGAAGTSLAAAVAIRWMDEERAAGRDPDAALEASVRALIEQLDDPAPSADDPG